MIRYTLRCDGGHEFEAWFRSSAEYERQEAAALVACATCASTRVGRGLMAPAVLAGAPAPQAAPEAAAVPAPAPSRTVAPGAMPDGMRALLSRVRAEIERHCDDVGRDFADEALRIHRGEVAPRGIYGEATEAEREALADEGVEVARIPWLPRSES